MKRYIISKYITAKSALDAIKIESKHEVDEVTLEHDWNKDKTDYCWDDNKQQLVDPSEDM